jgi:hypothetical protein
MNYDNYMSETMSMVSNIFMSNEEIKNTDAEVEALEDKKEPHCEKCGDPVLYENGLCAGCV